MCCCKIITDFRKKLYGFAKTESRKLRDADFFLARGPFQTVPLQTFFPTKRSTEYATKWQENEDFLDEKIRDIGDAYRARRLAAISTSRFRPAGRK